MALVIKDRIKETSTTTGTGTLTLAGAVSGFRSFADIGNSNTCPYVILEASESAPTAWEVGIGTYTSAGTTLSRDTVLRTSAGNTTKITLASGTHTVFCGWSADYALGSDFAQHAIIPGGRLTLTSGTPVTTSDVTGATSIYYTPYVSNVISLWTGTRWQPIEFSEYTLALGTLTSGKPYDVFAYLSSGALACEVLAWTNDTTRATAITIQDGRYCKSGDKTRLYLGTFYTTATTTTEDSAGKRYLWNAYNRAPKACLSAEGASHTNGSAVARQWNNGSGTLPTSRFINGYEVGSVLCGGTYRISALGTVSPNSLGYLYLNGSNVSMEPNQHFAPYSSDIGFQGWMASTIAPRIGENYLEIYERDAGATLTWDMGKSWVIWNA